MLEAKSGHTDFQENFDMSSKYPDFKVLWRERVKEGSSGQPGHSPLLSTSSTPLGWEKFSC